MSWSSWFLPEYGPQPWQAVSYPVSIPMDGSEVVKLNDDGKPDLERAIAWCNIPEEDE